MEKFNHSLQSAKTRIIMSTDSDLLSPSLENNVYESCKIYAPYLEKESTKVSIEKDRLSFNNAPAGFSFSPGEIYEYALFAVPIIGDLEVFAEVAKGHFYSGNNKFVSGKILYYKEFSEQPIAGNDGIIESIKGRAKIAINSVQTSLDAFKDKVDLFNENELKSNISEWIREEKEKRNMKSDAEDKLNPFA